MSTRLKKDLRFILVRLLRLLV